MPSEAEIWATCLREVRAGRRVVMAVVVQGRGSTPREIGARMLVGETGVIAGTVGGGCGEAEVLVAARKAIAGADYPATVEVDLSGDLEQTQIQACGGWMRVALREFADSGIPTLEALARAESGEGEQTLYECFNPKEAISFTLDQTNTPLEVASIQLPALAKRVAVGEAEWLVSTIGAAHELVIVGSGHVALPLCEMAQQVGFRVSILDDRPSFVTAERFPSADQRLTGKHEDLLASQELHDRSYVVIITRGHQHDRASLIEALKGDAAYIGMIGSRRRALETLRDLRSGGVEQAKLDKVHSPIGLDIGAETPAEIAIAVLAEIIKVRRGGSGVSLREKRPAL